MCGQQKTILVTKIYANQQMKNGRMKNRLNNVIVQSFSAIKAIETWRKMTFQLTFAVRSVAVTGCCLSFIYFLSFFLTCSENGCWCYWERKLDGNSLKCNFILHWKSMKLWWKRKKILIYEVQPHFATLQDVFLTNFNGSSFTISFIFMRRFLLKSPFEHYYQFSHL